MKRRILILILVVIIFLFTFTHIRMNQSNPTVLLPQLTTIETNIEFRDAKNTKVSKVAVAWHLDHMLKTINRITEVLESSYPETYQTSFSFTKIASLTAGFIPRGRAQSPQSVRPPEIIHTEAIFKQLVEARKNINTLRELEDKSNFDHPVFGMLNKAQTIRFLEVHTNHHLKIINDILRP
jgi:membrane-associated HD superfamily phosphohydrolase